MCWSALGLTDTGRESIRPRSRTDGICPEFDRPDGYRDYSPIELGGPHRLWVTEGVRAGPGAWSSLGGGGGGQGGRRVPWPTLPPGEWNASKSLQLIWRSASNGKADRGPDGRVRWPISETGTADLRNAPEVL